MPGVSSGTLEAIDVIARTIRVGSVVYQLGRRPELLGGLEVRQRVTVVWDEVGEQRQARTIAIDRTI